MSNHSEAYSLMKEAGISQPELAKLIDAPLATLLNVLYGNARRSKLQPRIIAILAAALSRPLDIDSVFPNRKIEDGRHSRGKPSPLTGAAHLWLFTQKKKRSAVKPITAACPRCGLERAHDGIGYRCECARVEIAGVTYA